MKFKSLTQLLDYFKDEATCIKYYEAQRWQGNPTCPHCKDAQPYVTNIGYRCRGCKKKFTYKVGTIFEGSKLPMRTWILAIYLSTSHNKGISSIQLATDLGVTQKTAWFMLHRIRQMLGAQNVSQVGKSEAVEIDETYVGGKEKNRHKHKRLAAPSTGLANDGTVYNKKKAVVGIIERGGNLILQHVADGKQNSVLPVLWHHVPEGIRLMTDDSVIYARVGNYNRFSVNHTGRQYVDGDVYTNTIENVFSCLKRSLYGTYHTVSPKHIQRYLNEFCAKFNTRHENHYARIDKFLAQSEGHIAYKQLTA